jgi:DNA-binding MarR family transcriptional regulator
MRPSLSDPGDRQENPSAKLTVGLFRLEQALAAVRGAAAGHAEVSPLQLQTLVDLRSRAGGCRTAADLARRYALRPATMSESLAGLARRRLIARRPSAEDGRCAELELTPRGERVVQGALSELDALVRLAERMSAAERGRALEAVVDLIARLSAEGWIQTDRMCATCRFFERKSERRAGAPHWCRLIDRALGPGDLRVDCPEHQPLTKSEGDP